MNQSFSQDPAEVPFLVVDLSRALAWLKNFARAHAAALLSAALLAVMAAQMFAVIWRKSITNDEIVHIPAGYYHLVAGNFQLNNEHPPLVKMWAALPLLIIQPAEPPPPKDQNENSIELTWGFHSRFWQANQRNFQTITHWPRAMMIVLTITLGFLIFAATRKLFGAHAGVLAVALFSLEPTVLAHGRVVHTDVPAALVYLLFFMALQAYWEVRTFRRAFLLGLATGVALLVKFSMIVLFPVLALGLAVALMRETPQGFRRTVIVHAAVVLGVAIFLINAAYSFQSPSLHDSDVRWVATQSAPIFNQIMAGIRLLSNIVPTYFLFGLYNVMIHNYYGHAASLLGMHSDLGWWYYFPVAFALKTTLPLLLLAVTALAWSVWRLVTRQNGKRDARFLFVAIPIVIYLAIALTSHINIGIRHFLPVYPFLFIAGGALLSNLLQQRKKTGIVVLFVLFGWMTFEVGRTFPDYMPYMNQLASSQPRWHYLADSNVEWGDDVGALAAYLKARGETRVSAALSAGWATLRFYDIEYLDLTAMPPESKPATRYAAIGASELNGATIFQSHINGAPITPEQRVNLLARYRNRQPEAVFGGSIYLFRERE